MFTYTGTWQSKLYPKLKGKLSLDLPYWDTEHFETQLELTYDRGSSFRADQTVTFALAGTVKNGKYILRSTELSLEQSFLISTSDKSGIYTCVKPYDIGEIQLSCKTTCMACIEEQPNQLAHMDYGGCLYRDESDLDESDTVEMYH